MWIISICMQIICWKYAKNKQIKSILNELHICRTHAFHMHYMQIVCRNMLVICIYTLMISLNIAEICRKHTQKCILRSAICIIYTDILVICVSICKIYAETCNRAICWAWILQLQVYAIHICTFRYLQIYAMYKYIAEIRIYVQMYEKCELPICYLLCMRINVHTCIFICKYNASICIIYM